LSTTLLPVRPDPVASELAAANGPPVPALIAHAGAGAERRFWEFFTVTIRNPNTRMAYWRACRDFFAWCDVRGLPELSRIEPMVVAAYVEELGRTHQAPSIKQHLAAIRMLFDWLVTGQVLPVNPASSVRGPKHVVRKGKTPVLDAEQARVLLDSIPREHVLDPRDPTITTPHVVGLRDRALIAVMLYSLARVGAVVGMKVEDYYHIGRRSWLRLHEKGGKFHEVPAHHNAVEYLDAYIEAAKIAHDPKGPLFRTAEGRRRRLTTNAMHRTEVLLMIKRRAVDAGLPPAICCHTFRATGITVYLENGGTLEKAQQMAAHESARTTKLYDRTQDQISLDEVERIII
jgi:integrase/recombinase XerD